MKAVGVVTDCELEAATHFSSGVGSNVAGFIHNSSWALFLHYLLSILFSRLIQSMPCTVFTQKCPPAVLFAVTQTYQNLHRFPLKSAGTSLKLSLFWVDKPFMVCLLFCGCHEVCVLEGQNVVILGDGCRL